MKKIFVCVCIMVFAVSAFANRQLISPDDSAKMGIVTNILWKESPINEEDFQKLLEIVQYPHDDVASYALTAAIVLKPSNLQTILKGVPEKRYNCKKIADYILKIGDKDVMQTVRNSLINQKLKPYTVPYPEEYYRDILVYSLLRQARKKKEKVVITENIEFTWGQNTLLTYADKPESEVWEYLSPRLDELKKNGDAAFAITFSLSAYSKVFFDESMAKINRADTPKLVKEILIDYLTYNQSRMSKEQKMQFGDLLKKGSQKNN